MNQKEAARWMVRRWLTRRQFLVYSAAAGAATLLASCGRGSKEDELVVGSWGGVWDESTQKHIVDPLVAETGAKVSILPGNSTEQYAKLVANPSNPPFDVLWLDVDFIAPLAAENMLLPLVEGDIPNLKNVYPNLIFFDRQAVAGNFGAITLVYDSDVVPLVDSWEILWDPSVACNFALSPFDSWAMQWLSMADRLAGGDGNDLNNGIEKTKTLAPAARALIGDYDLRPTFERREVAIGMVYSGEAYVMHDAGQASIRMAKPREGGVMIPNSLAIPKNARNPELAKQFVNFALAQQGQQGFIDDYATVPSNKTIEVSADLQPWMYLGDDVSRLFIPDYTRILAERDAVTERWNAEVVPLVGSNC